MAESRGFGYATNEAWRTPAQTDQWRWEQMVKHWQAEQEILGMILQRLDQIMERLEAPEPRRRQNRGKVASESRQ